MKLTVSENVEIVVNGEKILLEKGDIIEVLSRENESSNISTDLIDPYLTEFKKARGLMKLSPRDVNTYISWLQIKKPGLVENYDENKSPEANIATLRAVLLQRYLG